MNTHTLSLSLSPAEACARACFQQKKKKKKKKKKKEEIEEEKAPPPPLSRVQSVFGCVCVCV